MVSRAVLRYMLLYFSFDKVELFSANSKWTMDEISLDSIILLLNKKKICTAWFMYFREWAVNAQFNKIGLQFTQLG